LSADTCTTNRAGTVRSSKVFRAWKTVKLSPGTPGGAIQLAGGAPSKMGVGCARVGDAARMPTMTRTLDLIS